MLFCSFSYAPFSLQCVLKGQFTLAGNDKYVSIFYIFQIVTLRSNFSSLCHKVKSGCEETMTTYGFPWPSMLDCDKFPLDNDMCIASLSDKEDEDDSKS